MTPFAQVCMRVCVCVFVTTAYGSAPCLCHFIQPTNQPACHCAEQPRHLFLIELPVFVSILFKYLFIYLLISSTFCALLAAVRLTFAYFIFSMFEQAITHICFIVLSVGIMSLAGDQMLVKCSATLCCAVLFCESATYLMYKYLMFKNLFFFQSCKNVDITRSRIQILFM